MPIRLPGLLVPSALLAFMLALPFQAGAAQSGGKPTPAPVGPPAIVSHIKVLSNQIEDVSNLEAWKKSFIKDGMTDEQKALAVWTTVVKFRQQTSPPNEFIQDGVNPHDAIKDFNVYGYGQCCCASACIEQLARYVGLKAQGRGIHNHSVPEMWYDNQWHLYDASLMTYFPKADGKAASVDEIIDGISAWMVQHQELKGNSKQMVAFMRGGGWKNGPEVLSRCPFYGENGWLMAGTHGWDSTMSEYDGSNKFVYEYGYSQGYEVNVQLRSGERLVRNWSNKGLHVNKLEGAGFPVQAKVGEGDMAYAPKYGDLAPGRVGNGTLSYDVPLATGAFRGGALAADNLAATAEDKAKPAVHLKNAAQPGTLVIRMPCSYIYLSGSAAFEAVVGTGGGITVSLSDDNGLDWKPVSKITSSGPQKLDLTPLVYRRYDYRLKFEFTGAGTGLDHLEISDDVQHSQRPLPALDKGANTISFSSGAQEGRITIEGSLDDKRADKNLTISALHGKVTGAAGAPLFMQGKSAEVTFPLTTPGDMTHITMGCHYRARGKGDAWEFQASFDDGKSWKSFGKAEGPVAGNTSYATLNEIPAKTRSALVRYAGTMENTCGIFDFAINASYTEPHGGFLPVQVTYAWTENGQQKTDVHVAKKSDESYTITCVDKPVMASLTVELAP